MVNYSQAKKTKYTPEQRKELLAKWHKRIQDGTKKKKAAEELGIPYMNLYSWETQANAPKKAPAVAVIPPQTKKISLATVIKLTTPGGLVIECPLEVLPAVYEAIA